MSELLQGQESRPRVHADALSWGQELFSSPPSLPTPQHGASLLYVTTATKKPQLLSWTQKYPKRSVWMCFPDSVHVELCFLFVKNVKSYSKTKPPGPQPLQSLPLWAAICLGSPEASPLALRTQSPLTPKHAGRGPLLAGLAEGHGSLGKFSSSLPGLRLGLDTGFCVKHHAKCT